jgi:hypothetical protein
MPPLIAEVLGAVRFLRAGAAASCCGSMRVIL